MCLALPGKVLEVRGKSAVVDTPSGRKEVKVIDPVQPGDEVLVSMGFIVQNKTRK